MSQKQARAYGRILLKKMKGKGWKLRLHENMGWHYSVTRDFGALSMQVYQCDNGRGRPIQKYWCLFGTSPGGYAFWSTDTHHRNPNESVRLQYREARAFVESLSEPTEALWTFLLTTR